MPAKLVVVFDANVLIPLSMSSGRSLSTRLLSRLRNAGHVAAISRELLDEVAEKLRTRKSLRKWVGLSDEEIEEFLTQLPMQLGRRLRKKLTRIPRVVKADPDDDIIIATAVKAKAAYIVTEDQHLLDLEEYQGIRILNRKDFAAELDQLGLP